MEGHTARWRNRWIYILQYVYPYKGHRSKQTEIEGTANVRKRETRRERAKEIEWGVVGK